MSNISKYQRIYDLVSSKKCPEEELKNLKDMYAHIINSKRRLENVNSLSELLQLLEKRDYLNLERLIHFASMFEEFSNIDFLVEDISVSRSQNTVEQPPVILPRLSRDPKERAYQCIAADIGHKWTDLARALGVPEGDIDNLGTVRNISNRVYEILKFYEDRCDPRTFRSGLLEGLMRARRNDLRIKVQQIFDVYPC